MKHLSGAQSSDWLLSLPTNISLGCKSFTVKNTLAYYENYEITAVKGFITSGPGLIFEINAMATFDALYLKAFRHCGSVLPC